MTYEQLKLMYKFAEMFNEEVSGFYLGYDNFRDETNAEDRKHIALDLLRTLSAIDTIRRCASLCKAGLSDSLMEEIIERHKAHWGIHSSPWIFVPELVCELTENKEG